MRIHKQLPETTPEPNSFLGPRAFMKLNKSKQNLDQNLPQTKVEITVTEATPSKINSRDSIIQNSQAVTSSHKRRGRSTKSKSIIDVDHNDELSKVQKETKKAEMTVEEVNKKGDVNKETNTEKASGKVEHIESQIEEKNDLPVEEKSVQIAKNFNENQAAMETSINKEDEKTVNDEPSEIQELSAEIKNVSTSRTADGTFEIDNIKAEEATLENSNYNSKATLLYETIKENVPPTETIEVEDLNTTPQLLDESVISVQDSPPPLQNATAPIKDSTFSPEVDTSIQDSRPHIDVLENLNLTPIPRIYPIRTSTPLAQKLFKRETPRISVPVLSALAKVLSPKLNIAGKLNEASLIETFNGQFKMVGNPLEKSILKSSRRKRSMSVTDGESFMQKKVVFMSPEIVDISTIDNKMLQSFREEKETSFMKQNLMMSGSGARLLRQRSLSATDTPHAIKKKIPNFKAIHEQQFKKMESIFDHAQRKAQRAKRLVTPSKTLATVPEKEVKEVAKKKENAASKIPIGNRKPLSKIPSIDNINAATKRLVKRTISVDVVLSKKSNFNSALNLKKDEVKKIGITALPRAMSENIKTFVKFPTTQQLPATASLLVSQAAMRKKVEDRREKNLSLYKGNAVKVGLDHRKKNDMMLKGVRLNRRFELQMQHRKGITDNVDD